MRFCFVLSFILLVAARPCDAAGKTMQIKLKNGKEQHVKLVRLEKGKGVRVQIGGGETLVEWEKMTPTSIFAVRYAFLDAKDAKLRLTLGDYALNNSMISNATKCYNEAGKIDASLAPRVKEKLYEVRNAVLQTPIKAKISKRSVEPAISHLAKSAKTTITVDATLSSKLRGLKREERPVINYETEDTPLQAALLAILQPIKLDFINTPGGLVVYSSRLGISNSTVNILTKALKDGSTMDRVSAASIIGILAAEGGLPALRDAITDASPYVRYAAVRALSGFRDLSRDDSLKKALKDSCQTIRSEAIKAMGTGGGNDSVLDTLATTCLKGESSDIRLAAEILGRSGTKAAIARIRTLLNDKDTKKRVRDYHGKRVLIDALATVGDGQSIPMLRTFLFDKDSSLRQPSMIALARLGARDAIPDIIKASEKYKTDTNTVKMAIQALLLFGGDRAVSTAINIIQVTEDKKKRGDLIYYAQFTLPNPQMEEYLIPQLSDPDAAYVRQVSRALMAVGSMKSVPGLIAVIAKDPKQYDARRTLEVITGQRLGGDAKKWQEWWDKSKGGTEKPKK